MFVWDTDMGREVFQEVKIDNWHNILQKPYVVFCLPSGIVIHLESYMTTVASSDKSGRAMYRETSLLREWQSRKQSTFPMIITIIGSFGTNKRSELNGGIPKLYLIDEDRGEIRNNVSWNRIRDSLPEFE
jgi:hypothetical protein